MAPLLKPSMKPLQLRRAALAMAISSLFALACSVPASLEPLLISISYETMAGAGEFPTLPSCAEFSKIEAKDGRSAEEIGRRYIEDKESSAVPVRVTSNLGNWVRDGAVDAIRRSGAPTRSSGGPVLRFTLDRIHTNENVLRRAGYDGKVVMSAELASSDGKACWGARLEGYAENYGYAGNPEAYEEMLNHALDRAMIEMIGLPGFQKAACECR